MNGIQEVSGSIPLISTKRTDGQPAVCFFCVQAPRIGPLTQNAKHFLSEAEQVAKQAAQRRSFAAVRSRLSPPKEQTANRPSVSLRSGVGETTRDPPSHPSKMKIRILPSFIAINASNNAGASTIFIEFMLSAIKTALLEASGQKEKPLGKNAQNAADRRQFIMDHLGGKPLIRNADLCEGLGISPATANRVLRELNDDGTLERVRDGKFWAYRLKEAEGAAKPV